MSTDLATDWEPPATAPSEEISQAHRPVGSDIYFEHSTQFYYVLDHAGCYMKLNEGNVKRRLRAAGVLCQPNTNPHVSPLESTLIKIQDDNRVDYAGPLAGYRKGVHVIEGRRILVTDEAKLITPMAGTWPTLRAVIEGMLADQRQIDTFYGWLKFAVNNLRSEKRMPGQVLVLAGPVEGGKSLVQALITQLLGGRSSHPYGYISGKTDFNSELFGAEHLLIEDESASTDIRTRREIGAHIKEITVNETQRCHCKNKTALSLTPKWRMSITVNDEPENLMVLPPIDRSLEDKIILLKADKKPMPMSTATGDEKRLFWNCLLSELPAFTAFLEKWTIPDGLASQRFGIAHYHHPEIVSTLSTLSPEYRLLELIDTELFSEAGDKESVWVGTSLKLQQILTRSDSRVRREGIALFTFTTACGVYLSRLEGLHNGRVGKRTIHGKTEWTIRYSPQQGGG